MEIEITSFFNNAAPMDYSASVAEIGSNAGPDTWAAACEDSPDYFLLNSEEKQEAARVYFKGFGAWTDEEIGAFSVIELNALLLQFIAGDMREAGLYAGMSDEEWKAYEEEAMHGNAPGRIYGGPLTVNNDGKVYFYMGD